MKVSLNTFEYDLRQRLLDVVYSQWHDLGVPFSSVLASPEVIDAEALLWCSLEFLPAEPRLCEGVVDWFHSHSNYIIRQRLRNWTQDADPRACIWQVLEAPIEPWHGVSSAKRSMLDSFPQMHSAYAKASALKVIDAASSIDVTEFCNRLKDTLSKKQAMESRIGSREHVKPAMPEFTSTKRSTSSRIGKPANAPSTLLLRARDLIGNDTRHFLLVYLLANPSGGRLRDIQAWTGYSYRSMSETATRWQTAGVVDIDHGYCRLTKSEPWHILLNPGIERIVLVNFFDVFESCIRLLHTLARARQKNLDWAGSVITTYRRDTCKVLSSSILSDTRGRAASVNYLLDLFPSEDKVAAGSFAR